MASFTTIVLAVLAIAAISIYFFGIPPEFKRKLERGALRAMGENKASYAVKDQISRIPTTDQKEVKDLKSSISRGVGSVLQNPLGEATGETADNLAKPFTGR